MTAQHLVPVGSVTCGSEKLFLISGPCVIEDESIMMQTAEQLKLIAERLDLPLIFKSSFMKDNRSAMAHYHGPGRAIARRSHPHVHLGIPSSRQNRCSAPWQSSGPA